MLICILFFEAVSHCLDLELSDSGRMVDQQALGSSRLCCPRALGAYYSASFFM